MLPLRLQLGRAYRLKGDLEKSREPSICRSPARAADLLRAHYELADIGLIQHRPQEAVKQAS